MLHWITWLLGGHVWTVLVLASPPPTRRGPSAGGPPLIGPMNLALTVAPDGVAIEQAVSRRIGLLFAGDAGVVGWGTRRRGTLAADRFDPPAGVKLTSVRAAPRPGAPPDRARRAAALDGIRAFGLDPETIGCAEPCHRRHAIPAIVAVLRLHGVDVQAHDVEGALRQARSHVPLGERNRPPIPMVPPAHGFRVSLEAER